MPTALLGLYWGPRQQSLDACTENALRSLTSMARHGFSPVYQLGRSRKDALKRNIEPTRDAVRAMLARGVNRTDFGKTVIPELGFSLRGWSGGPDAQSWSLDLSCGSYEPRISNVFLLNLPGEGPACWAEGASRLRPLFETLVEIWDPEQGVLSDSEALRWKDGILAPDMPSHLRHPSR